MVRCAAAINPTGHLPISFGALQHPRATGRPGPAGRCWFAARISCHTGHALNCWGFFSSFQSLPSEVAFSLKFGDPGGVPSIFGEVPKLKNLNFFGEVPKKVWTPKIASPPTPWPWPSWPHGVGGWIQTLLWLVFLAPPPGSSANLGSLPPLVVVIVCPS